MSSNNKLDSYRRKRDFSKTPEPSGQASPSGERPLFVIQKHLARTLHYDFRLEVDGVLKSWSIPKGPSTDPREKRLAIPTEDHPLDYAEFEGTIPEDEYGGGVVLVWDTGPYRNFKEEEDGEVPLKQCLDDGHVTVWLEGHKLRGGFALIRTGKGDDTRWLFVKMDDDGADARRKPVNTEPLSVLTGRSLEDVRKDES